MDDEEQRIAQLREALEFRAYVGICNAIDRLRETMPPDLAAAALACARTFDDDEWARSQIVMSLARHLPDDLFDAALEIAEGLGDPDIGNRDHVLAALATHFPRERHPAVLDVARRTGRADDRVAALTRLVPLMPELAGEALDAINAPGIDPSTRAWAYGKLAAHDPSLLPDAFAAIAATPADSGKAFMLTPLLAVAQPHHIPPIAAIFQTIRDPDIRNALRQKLKARFPEVLWLK